VLGEEAATKLENATLFNSTGKNRIEYMPVNVSDQLFEEFLPQNLDFLFNWNGLRKQPTAYDRFAHNSYVKDFPVQRKGHLNVVNLLS